jgi:Fe-S cluster assembly ATP-binding protein
MLSVKDLSVSVWDREILKDITYDFDLGKNYCILWKNWSGKSSLAMAIMWNPKYKITNWEIILDWEKVSDLSPDKRARSWIFLAFQNIPEIPWIKLFEFLKWVYDNSIKTTTFLEFKKLIEPLLEDLQLSKDFLRRDLNVWFSWGERRKLEILQMKLLNPKYIILDEIDSWLDVDAFKVVAEMLKSLSTDENSFIIITHIFTILDYINVDNTLVLDHWSIVEEWWEEIAQRIKNNWFKK